MATFPEFALNLMAGKTPRKLVYVCGNEPRLRTIVVDLLRRGHGELDYVSIRATGKNDDEIWSELDQLPLIDRRALKGGKSVEIKRHITVRDAHLMKDLEPMDEWLREMRAATACFESSWEDFDRPMKPGSKYCSRGHYVKDPLVVTSKTGKETQSCAVCEEARKIIVARGQIVVASSPRSEASQVAMSKYLAKVGDCTITQAADLLRKCAYDVGAAVEVIDKLRRLSLPINSKYVDIFMLSSDDSEYEQALRMGNRARAATNAANVNESDVPYIFGRLDYWLGQVTRAAKVVRHGATTADLAKKLDVDYGTASRLAAHAGKYSQDSINRATLVLATASSDWAQGRRAGVLQLLAAGW